MNVVMVDAKKEDAARVLIERNAMCLEAMLNLVAVYHKGQRDKGGQPYILHPIHIMGKVLEKYPADYELAAIALGHDLFEDTGVNADILRACGITERVITGVQIMTKINNEPPEEYLARLMLNWDTVRVKLEDLRHNMDVLRIKRELYAGDLARLNKYRKMYNILGKIKGGRIHGS